jgi:glycerophosphoryl diester phosphodiesterase
MGADFIEPDLVQTRDGYLIARHENDMSETTNVSIKFPNRKKTKIVDGETKTGWFTEDFTLAEIKTLRARERLAFRSHKEDDKYEIPTFEEILGFLKLEEKARGKKIGIIPELKHSTYFNQLHLPMEESLVRLLNKYNMNQPQSLTIVQSFEVTNLKKLRSKIKAQLVQLLDDPDKSPFDLVTSGANPLLTYQQMATPEGLKAIREYADWVSPHKNYIVAIGADGQISGISDFLNNAHAAGLKVLTYTMRSEENYLAKAYKNNYASEYGLFFGLGVDGVFSDFPDHAVAAKKEYMKKCDLK